MRTQFVDSSQLVLANFLRPEIASELESLIRAEDAALESSRRGTIVAGRTTNLIPPHDSASTPPWTLVGPPHIQRFAALPFSIPSSSPRLATLLASINALFSSPAFRTFLATLTSLLATSYTTQVRRFRPGLDYTLARGEPSEGEARLDVGLGLTPVPSLEADAQLWEGGEVGGWELWLAGEEGGDEATYGAGGDDEDEPLLALEPGWNRLHVVLRDAGVLRFVKYLSGKAPASRWDVGGEWEVVAVEESDDEVEGEEVQELE